VRLDSLERLDSLPLAQKLAQQKGELRLGLRELSPAIATELAKHRGFDSNNSKSNPRGRVDGAASVLRFDNIESLSPETAEALAAHEGVLVLNGLVSLDPAVAASLAKRTGSSKTKRTGTLVLNGLPEISTEAAAALAAFTGEIVLKAITELSPETAAALAKHKGRLHLTGLVRTGPETLVALKSHPRSSWRRRSRRSCRYGKHGAMSPGPLMNAPLETNTPRPRPLFETLGRRDRWLTLASVALAGRA